MMHDAPPPTPPTASSFSPEPAESTTGTTAPPPLPYRIGHGYDLHRLEPLNASQAAAPSAGAPTPDDRARTAGPRPFVLAGVRLEHDRGPVGHSDGDAVYHAATDAILAALGEPDIGELFPDADPQYADADSAVFLEAARDRMRRAGYAVSNLDVTIICERPKISPRKAEMIGNLAACLDCDRSQVNVKAKTHERVDAVGEGRAVEVHVVVLLQRQRR